MTKEQAINKYKLLNEKDFSEITGIPVSTLQKMRTRPERNGPPFVKQRGAVRYTLHQYERWLDQNTVTAEDLKKEI